MPGMLPAPFVLNMAQAAAQAASRREAFVTEKDESTGAVRLTGAGKVVLIVCIVVYLLLLGIPAAFLSWRANSLCYWGVLFKLLFAFCAMVFALEYLLCYLIFKHDIVAMLRMTRAMVGVMPGMHGMHGMHGMPGMHGMRGHLV